jgi:hypothetical protein
MTPLSQSRYSFKSHCTAVSKDIAFHAADGTRVGGLNASSFRNVPAEVPTLSPTSFPPSGRSAAEATRPLFVLYILKTYLCLEAGVFSQEHMYICTRNLGDVSSERNVSARLGASILLLERRQRHDFLGSRHDRGLSPADIFLC